MASFAPPTVFHVTHWKAGSQWIRRILTDCVSDRIVAPCNDNMQYLHSPLVEGGVYPTVYVTREEFHSVRRPASFRRFLVIRDLRDTLVAGYFGIRDGSSFNDPKLVRLQSILNASTREEGLLTLLDEWLPDSAAIQASWLAYGEPFIRYEDLIDHDIAILEPLLLEHCELEVEPSILRAIICRNRLENSTGGCRSGESDVSAHERQGTPGDWKNYFTGALANAFHERFGRLLSDAGYGPSLRSSRVASTLEPDEVLAGYEAVSALYPFVPSLSHWRAWEFAAYKHHRLEGRVLDLGCGDGHYFRLLWPELADVVGVDQNPEVADIARRSGVYREVVTCRADNLPFPDASFDAVFANCSLEHMDRLDEVLAKIVRCLKPGGILLCSVVTDRFLRWSVLPMLLEQVDDSGSAERVRRHFSLYHNLVNPLPVSEWTCRLERSGLVVNDHIPILPRLNTGMFLLMDTVWHIERRAGGELGDMIQPFLSANPRFPHAFRSILRGFLELETDWETCGGAVFRASKPA